MSFPATPDYSPILALALDPDADAPAVTSAAPPTPVQAGPDKARVLLLRQRKGLSLWQPGDSPKLSDALAREHTLFGNNAPNLSGAIEADQGDWEDEPEEPVLPAANAVALARLGHVIGNVKVTPCTVCGWQHRYGRKHARAGRCTWCGN